MKKFKNNSKYKCIFFDLHYTLIEPSVSEIDFIYEMSREVGLNFERDAISAAFDDNWQKIDPSIYITLNDQSSYRDYWVTRNTEVVKKIDSKLPDKLCLEFGKKLNYSFANDSSKFKVLESAHETLSTLSKRNIKLIVITNALPGVRKIIKGLNLKKYFNDIVVSTEEGISKPDPAIFDRMLRKYKITPGECLIVGDSVGSDILAGINCGMDTCLFQKNKNKPTTETIQSTYSVDHLSKLLSIVC